MIQNFLPTFFADYYNCDVYGANAYGQCAEATSGGGLVDTGYNIIIPVAFGLALLIAGLIWAFKVIRRRQTQSNSKS